MVEKELSRTVLHLDSGLRIPSTAPISYGSDSVTVAHDSGRRFRLGAAELEILRAADGCTASELSELFPNVPGRASTMSIVTTALSLGLLTGDNSPSVAVGGKPTMGLLMFGRTPLIRSDVKLRRIADRLRVLPQPLTEVVGVVLAVLGLVAFPYLVISAHPGMGAIQPRSVVILLASLVGIVTLHELAHALTLLRFGGSVHELGVAVLCFLPIIYTDITDMWTLSSKRQQVQVVLAGIIIQLQISAGLGIAYALLPGHSKDTVGTTIALVASANMAAVLINLNPLLKLDGYWLIAVLTNNPNLQARSLYAIPELFRKRAHTRRSLSFAVFGLASVVYAVFLLITTISSSVAMLSGFGWWFPLLLVVTCFLVVATRKLLKHRRHG